MTRLRFTPYVPVTKEFYANLIAPAHKGQKYGNKPYTIHLRDVERTWHNLFETPYDHEWDKTRIENEIELCDNAEFACLAHDYLEDCEGASVEKLREQGCPEPAIKAIILVTKDSVKSYKQYLRDIVEDELAFQVKVVDTTSNLNCSMKDGNFKRVIKYSEQLNLLYRYRQSFIEGEK